MGGKFEVKAGQHQFKGGEKVEVNTRQFLDPHSNQIQLVDHEGLALGKDIPYYIYAHDIQKEFYGRTNHEGKTQRIYSKDVDQLDVKVGKDAFDFLIEKGIKV